MIRVADNGPGIAADVVDDILDFSVRVSSREAYVGPTRGAQGNALKTVLAMPFALDGEAGRVVIESQGTRHEIAFGIDRIAQEPRAEHRRSPSPVRTGTVVTRVAGFIKLNPARRPLPASGAIFTSSRPSTRTCT